MDAPPSRVKSILLHAYRFSGKPYTSLPTEVWFLIKFTPKGAVHKEIFQNLPRNQLAQFYCCESTCVRIDSSLYVLGGSHKKRASDSVRRLNLKNPKAGWKPCRRLPYPSCSAKVAVSGNRIYLFPQSLNVFELRNPGGFSYDISNQMGYLNMYPPPGNPPNRKWEIPLCFGFDFVDRKPGFDCGVRKRGVAILSDDRQYLSVYNKNKNSWKDRKGLKIPGRISEARSPPKHAFLNGILYLSYCDDQDIPEYESNTTTLYAYEFKSGKQLLGNGGVKLPMFEKLGEIVDESTYFVALADYKLCYVWSLRADSRFHDGRTIYIATVVVDPESLTVTVLSQDEFVVNAYKFQSCIPLDCCPDRTGRRKSNRHNLKLKLSEESQQDRNLYLRLRSLGGEYDRLINQMSSKDAKREMIVRIKKIARKKRSLETNLKALQDSLCNENHQIFNTDVDTFQAGLTVARLNGP